MVRAAAYHFKLHPLAFYTAEDRDHGVRGADWIILTPSDKLAADLSKVATPIQIHSDPVLWTDDRSSIYEIIR